MNYVVIMIQEIVSQNFMSKQNAAQRAADPKNQKSWDGVLTITPQK